MSSLPIEAWVFDLDGTLVDSRARLYGAYVEVAATAGIPVLSPVELRAAVEKRTLERELGLDGDAAARLLTDWYRAFGNNTPASPAFDGAADALRACARLGARIAISTARPMPPEHVLDELAEVGLASLVDVVTTTESVGGPILPDDGTLLSGYLAKARQTRAALDELGVEAHRAAMVSDEPSDLLEAAELGFGRLVGVTTGGTPASDFGLSHAIVLPSVADLAGTVGADGWPLRLADAAAG